METSEQGVRQCRQGQGQKEKIDHPATTNDETFHYIRRIVYCHWLKTRQHGRSLAASALNAGRAGSWPHEARGYRKPWLPSYPAAWLLGCLAAWLPGYQAQHSTAQKMPYIWDPHLRCAVQLDSLAEKTAQNVLNKWDHHTKWAVQLASLYPWSYSRVFEHS